MQSSFSLPTPAIIVKKELAPEPFPHTIEGELLGVRPRPVVWMGQTLFWRLILQNLCVGVGVVLFFLAQRDIASWTALIKHGVQIKADVYDKYTTRSPDDARVGGSFDRYFLQYRFVADGRTFRSQIETDSVGYSDPNNGKLLVTYLPNSGGIYQTGTVTPWRRADRVWEWIVGGCVGVGVCGMGILLQNYVSGEQERLLRLGVVATGRVMSGIVTHQKQTRTYWLDYKFVAHDTHVYTGKAAVTKKMYDAQVWGRSTATVLYDESNPHNNALYCVITAARVLGK